MYKCKPERNPRQAMLLVLISAAVCAAAFVGASFLPKYQTIGQLFAVLLLSTAIIVIVRYTINEMEYTVSGSIFEVSKTVGNRVTPVLSMDLGTVVAFVDKETYKNSPEFSSVKEKINVNQNFKAASFVCVVEIGGVRKAVEFEPNAVFAEIVREAINNSKKD